MKDVDAEARQQRLQQEWNSSKDATSTCSGGGDLSGSPVTRSLYASSDHHTRRSRPVEVDVGCREFVDKFTTRVANSSKRSLSSAYGRVITDSDNNT